MINTYFNKMYYFQHNMLSSLASNFDEKQWVEQIRKTLDDEFDEETDEIPVTIFGVPKTLMLSHPDCYIPQLVSIGPYHHLRAELYDMEKYKIAAAKRNQKEFENIKLQDIVDHLMKLELTIRAYYHRPLSYNGSSLAWMMAVDASFLFEFLQVCGVKEGNILTKNPSRLAHLRDLSRNKLVLDTLFRDIILLENQIPLFVMRMLLEFRFSSQQLADETLLSLLIGVAKELSPFKTVKVTHKLAEVKDCAHFLDFLYYFIVPKLDRVASEIIEIHEDGGGRGDADEDLDKEIISPFVEPTRLRRFLNELCKILSKLLKGLIKLPWTILTKLPIVKILKNPVEKMLRAFRKDRKKDDDKDETSSMRGDPNYKPLVLEEITIPSATRLFEVGVQFFPANEGIMSIKFDVKTKTFHIPIISLDVNSEVVLRNLVAYEACNACRPLVLTRYAELMYGILITNEDAKLLCERGIIINHLKSEKEVADLWIGMSKSIRLTKLPSLDRVIGDVNNFYNRKWKVKFGKFMKKYVFGSWKFLTFIAAILLLILTTLQAFCQIYDCSRLLPIQGLESGK